MAMPGEAALGPAAEAIAVLTQALDRALGDGAAPPPLGDPREPEVIRAWAEMTDGVDAEGLEEALAAAIQALAALPGGTTRLADAGLMPDMPVQASLIAGYVRMFRRIKAITAAGGLDDATLMAETRRDIRALNRRMAEALDTIRTQRRTIARMNTALIERERRQAQTTLALEQARDDVTAARAALARLEAERDDAARTAEAVRAERDELRRDLNRTRASVEDLKAKYLEKFALALHDLNRARETLYNDPRSSLPAMKASVAQGYYMILEDMGAGAEARKLMASISEEAL
ncbi:hypothetical protein [Roseospira goensis]|uniref:Molecular chaperone GrpE (Heat shock protein) n=1 Tax=Roseospira goensis TaxID=391922 RepID=A0A7W6WLF2_9PROT|nr:hypothetical protein [Roseospira goensis]MBB4287356.1 molecular chaperone GrpE (heat shock protein) [Roseospira goensis]